MMKVFKQNIGRKRRWPKVLLFLSIFLVLAGVGVFITVNRIYNQNLLPVNAAATEDIVVAIPRGSSLDEIAKILKKNGVIRADWAFKQYVRSHEQTDSLQAGTYRFKASQDVASIVKDLVNGKVAVDLFTILPGYRLSQIRQSFIDDGFSAAEVDEALNPKLYAGSPALTDKPAEATLEGYLYPDSFQRTAETTVQTIIGASLAEMADALTPDIRAGIAKQGLSVHQGIIIASIIEKEIPGSPTAASEDRSKAAQVFLKRYKTGMQLGSDVTACYGAIVAGAMKEGENCDNYVYFESAYNTRLHEGMPPGPISNVSVSSLSAVASPADTDYLFFVAGKDCVTRFSNTNAEHEELVAKYGLSTESSCN